jgi:hypothetical protein
MAEVWHSGKRIPPDRFLILDRSGGKTERRVDDYAGMKQLIESVEVARVTGGQPSKYHGLTTIDHRTKVTRPARATVRYVGSPAAVRASSLLQNHWVLTHLR